MYDGLQVKIELSKSSIGYEVMQLESSLPTILDELRKADRNSGGFTELSNEVEKNIIKLKRFGYLKKASTFALQYNQIMGEELIVITNC
ncbi:hypothetical protein J4204_02215 [Candidatus Woesearchaeota archaeon]|nr:hypothetical protein [Candidatus Woesearchaeota archaeon]